MSCLHPSKVTLMPDNSIKFGKWFYFMDQNTGDLSQFFEVPCGKCEECRKDQRRLWTERLQLEASCYEPGEVWMLTLTYDDVGIQHLNRSSGLYSLNYDDCRQFLKRLRNRFFKPRESDLFCFPGLSIRIRFFASGEYGSLGRPHFHIVLFGFDFSKYDRLILQNETAQGPVFSSALIGDLWPYGFNTVLSAGPSACGYVTGYVMKKLGSLDKYSVLGLQPERSFMSTHPAIGSEFFRRNADIIRECNGYVNPITGDYHPVPRFALRTVFSDDLGFIAKVNYQKKESAVRRMDTEHVQRGERPDIAHIRIAAALSKQKQLKRAGKNKL